MNTDDDHSHNGTAIRLLRSLCLRLHPSTIEDVFHRLDGSFTAAYGVLLQMDELEPILRQMKIPAAFLPSDDKEPLVHNFTPLGNIPVNLLKEITAIGGGRTSVLSAEGIMKRLSRARKNSLCANDLKEKLESEIENNGKSEEDDVIEKESAVPATEECQCCLEDFPTRSHMVSCEKGHMFCFTCFNQHIENSVLRNDFTTIPCFLPAFVEPCDTTFSNAAIIHGIRHATTRRRFFTLKANSLSTKVWGKTWKQQEKAEITPEPSKTPKQRFEDALAAMIIRNCPGCALPLLKAGGCNHLTCPKCKTHSCYVCRARIPGIFFGVSRHYSSSKKCRHFSSDETYDRKARDRMAMKMQKRALVEGDTELADIIEDWLSVQEPSGWSHAAEDFLLFLVLVFLVWAVYKSVQNYPGEQECLVCKWLE